MQFTADHHVSRPRLVVGVHQPRIEVRAGGRAGPLEQVESLDASVFAGDLERVGDRPSGARQARAVLVREVRSELDDPTGLRDPYLTR